MPWRKRTRGSKREPKRKLRNEPASAGGADITERIPMRIKSMDFRAHPGTRGRAVFSINRVGQAVRHPGVLKTVEEKIIIQVIFVT
jgi:hypothetical protein